MKTTTKILFIGLDAADKDLILKWAGEGILPNLRSLMDRACRATTVNPPGFYVGALWPSFFTGMLPPGHGRYAFEQIQPGSYKRPYFSPSHLKKEPFWNELSRAGKKVAVIDVPKVGLSENLNGIQVVDWATHDAEREGFRTNPPSLASEIKKRFGLNPLPRCDTYRKCAREFMNLRDKLVSRVRMKTELACFLLKRGGWDCFMTVFSESHCVGHQCWHLHDKTHVRHDPGIAREVGNPIRDVYREIDAGVGRLLSEVGPETTVFLLASHGMGPHYEGTYLLDEILKRLEKNGSSNGIRRRTKKVWRLLPATFRGKIFRMRKKLYSGFTGRPCFKVPNNSVYGAIRINLSGREPHGKVQPGAEYEAFCKALSRDLLSLVNLETKKPVVRHVYRSRDLYPEGNIDHFPDLLVDWNREAPIRRVTSPKTGEIQGDFEGCRTGDHKSEGMFLARGPSLRPGAISDTIRVIDLAPTMASLLGVELSGVDGKRFTSPQRHRPMVRGCASAPILSVEGG